MIKIKSNKIILGEDLFDGYLYLEDGKVLEVSKNDRPCEESYDYTDLYVSPGFIDLHTHGAGGHAFMNSTPEDVVKGSLYHLRFGTTCILPTISAGAFPVMRDAVINIQKAMDSGKAPNIYGAHLEGPYLSQKQCGAQNTAYITAPVQADYESLITEYGAAVKRWTYAPENDPKGAFCKFITSHGVIASAGHSDAIYSDMQVAMANGCNLITHLYSCTSTITRDHGFRRLGLIETAYLEDGLYVEIIADGKHLPPRAFAADPEKQRHRQDRADYRQPGDRRHGHQRRRDERHRIYCRGRSLQAERPLCLCRQRGYSRQAYQDPCKGMRRGCAHRSENAHQGSRRDPPCQQG